MKKNKFWSWKKSILTFTVLVGIAFLLHDTYQIALKNNISMSNDSTIYILNNPLEPEIIPMPNDEDETDTTLSNTTAPDVNETEAKESQPEDLHIKEQNIEVDFGDFSPSNTMLGDSENFSEEETEELPNENETIVRVESPIENTAVVYTFLELKSALESKDITEVYLGADIEMKYGGILINGSKKHLIIDGIDPADKDKKIHTLTDHNIEAVLQNITLLTGETLKSITVQNLNIKGKNLYGTVHIADALQGVTVTYKKISYDGPQLAYNRYGTVIFEDSTIRIGKFDGISLPSEVGEVGGVIFKGKVTISQTDSQYNEIFYFPLKGGTIQFSPGAVVDVTTAGDSGFIYSPFGVNFELLYGSSFSFIGFHRFWDGAITVVNNVTIEDYSKMHITLTKTKHTAPLRINGDLYVGEGAELHAISYDGGFPAVRVNKKAEFKDPGSVLLYSEGYRSLIYILKGLLDIGAQQINYWGYKEDGIFPSTPDYSWRKNDKSLLTVKGTVTPEYYGDFIDIETNYDNDNDTSASIPPTIESFSLNNSRIIAFGRLEIEAYYEYMTPISARIVGTTTPETKIEVIYKNESDSLVSFQTSADKNGVFTINLPTILPEWNIITVKGSYSYLTNEVKITSSKNALHFVNIPSSMFFSYSELSTKKVTIPRMSDSWKIDIFDSLGIGSEWELTAHLVESTDTENNLSLPYGAVVFIDENKNVNELHYDGTVTVLKHKAIDEVEIVSTNWSEDTGILLQIEPGSVLAEKNYSMSILWMLKNAP